MENKLPEYWIRGPLDGFSPFTNPIAAALLQVLEETEILVRDFPDEKLWECPFERASVGFHLNHLRGVLDRLFTYARGEKLTPEQFKFLKLEDKKPDQPLSTRALYEAFSTQVEKSLIQLRNTKESELIQERKIGRKKLPSTVIGLYVHAAEHSTRHLGQMLVTISALKVR